MNLNVSTKGTGIYQRVFDFIVDVGRREPFIAKVGPTSQINGGNDFHIGCSRKLAG
jgi:hypothetical protein